MVQSAELPPELPPDLPPELVNPVVTPPEVEQSIPPEVGPGTPAWDYYMQLLQNRPEREMGWRNRLAAGLIGFGGNPQAAMSIYDRPVREWGEQVGHAQNAAQMEGLQNYRQQQVGVQERSIAAREAETAARIFSMNNPNLQVRVTDGQVIGVNPRTGESSVIYSGLTDGDEIFLRHNLGLQTEGVRQEGRTDLQGQRDTAAGQRNQASIDAAAQRVAEQERGRTRRAEEATERTRAQTEAADRRAQAGRDAAMERHTTPRPSTRQATPLERAKQLINEKPEYAKFIDFGDDGETITINTSLLRDGWWSDDVNENADTDREAILNYIYGSQSNTNRPPSSPPNEGRQSARDIAINELRANGKAVTEANINLYLRMSGGQ
jgi:hypothetical protein